MSSPRLVTTNVGAAKSTQNISPSARNKNLTITTPSPSKLPKCTEVYTSPPFAAGVPVLELIRKLEEEKTLSREDRVALNSGLYDPERREKLTKALQDVELGANPKFAIRRLKALIYQNGAGECSNRTFQQVPGIKIDGTNNYNNSSLKEDGSNVNSSRDNQEKVNYGPVLMSSRMPSEDIESKASMIVDPQVTVHQLVGDHPTYDGPGNDNICHKIAMRLTEIQNKLKNNNNNNNNNQKSAKKFAVIVGCGSFNPLTRMHMRTYFLAKQALESRHGYIVLGSILSPAHSSTVRERFRSNTSEILPSPHRLAIAQIMVQESKWITIDPWEITRRRSMDYLSFLDHIQEMLKDQFPDTEIKLIYLCKANMVPKISPTALREHGYATVVVCRTPDSDNLRDNLGAKWTGIIHVVEDTAILDASMDVVTSRRVREKIRSNDSIAQLVGDLVQQYVKHFNIGAKMNGLLEWTEAEKRLPKILSRPAPPTLGTRALTLTLAMPSQMSSVGSMSTLNTLASSVVTEHPLHPLHLRLDKLSSVHGSVVETSMSARSYGSNGSNGSKTRGGYISNNNNSNSNNNNNITNSISISSDNERLVSLTSRSDSDNNRISSLINTNNTNSNNTNNNNNSNNNSNNTSISGINKGLLGGYIPSSKAVSKPINRMKAVTSSESNAINNNNNNINNNINNNSDIENTQNAIATNKSSNNINNNNNIISESNSSYNPNPNPATMAPSGRPPRKLRPEDPGYTPSWDNRPPGQPVIRVPPTGRIVAKDGPVQRVA